MARTLVLAAFLPIGPAAAQTPGTAPPAATDLRPSADARLKRYLNAMAGPVATAEGLALAAISQVRDQPVEWSTDVRGYGRRFASVMGEGAVQESVTYGLAEALRIDTGFHKSRKQGFFPRAGDALLQAVVSRRADGRRVASVPLLAGYTAGGMAMISWYPERYRAVDGLGYAGLALSMRGGVNLVREFILSR